MIRIRHSSNAFWLCERPNKLTWSYLIWLDLTWSYLILLDLTWSYLYILVYTCIYLYIRVSLLRAFCSNHCLGAPGEVSPKTLARPCTDVSFFCSWMSRILVSPSLPWRLTPHHHHQVCCQIGPRTGPSPVTSKRDKQVQHFQENKTKRRQ